MPRGQGPRRAVQQPPHVDRELVGLGPGEQHREVQRVEEARLADPPAPLDELGVHERDLAGRAPEVHEPQPHPEPQRLRERHRGERGDRRARGRARSLAHHIPGREPAPKPCRRLRYDASVGTDTLVIHGAREHNLKNITLELPRNALIVFTGLSGSGKSSLAFDTIYAEGQRRYVESLSSYARQFLGPDGEARRRLHRGPLAGDLDRPEVDLAEPSIHGRDDHRDLRLPPGPVRPDRASALPEVRTADRPPDAGADRRPGDAAARRAPGSRSSRRSSGGARASTRSC